MKAWIFRLCLACYLSPSPGETVSPTDAQALATADCVSFAGHPGVTELCVVCEKGSEAENWHLHGYFKLDRSHMVVRAALRRHFRLGVGNGAYSLKEAVPAKVDRYFKYMAKGVHGVRGSPVICLYEDSPHLWEMMHAAFHDEADERVGQSAAGRRQNMEAWYESLAKELTDQGKTSKEDVLARVCKYYCEESKKGFEKFAVTRTFWRVYALVSGADAQRLIYESVAECVFRV